MSNTLNFNILGSSPAQQQIARRQQLQAQAAASATNRGGGSSLGAGIANFINKRRETKELQEESELINRNFESNLEQADGDRITATAMSMNDAANELIAQGQHARGRELRQASIDMMQSKAAAEAERNKLLSETRENEAQAATAGAASVPEVVRLQNTRESLRNVLANHEPGSAQYQIVAQLMDEQTDRINKLTAITGTTEHDPGVTTKTQGEVEDRLLGFNDRLERLDEISAAYDPDLLDFWGKGETTLAMVRARFGSQDPEVVDRVTAWTDLSQAAFSDMNLLLRDLSGAAVTQQEFDRQKRVLPNAGTYANPMSGDNPIEFKRKLENQITWARAAQARYEHMVETGQLTRGQPITEELAEANPVERFIPTRRTPQQRAAEPQNSEVAIPAGEFDSETEALLQGLGFSITPTEE
jgi:hypothetical protein